MPSQTTTTICSALPAAEAVTVSDKMAARMIETVRMDAAHCSVDFRGCNGKAIHVMVAAMAILVTGGAGFIGSHVVEALLARGDEVTVLDDFNDFYDPAIKRRNVGSFAKRARIVEADIRGDLSKVFRGSKFDAVVHLAARAGVRYSLDNPRLYTDVNVMGTQNLLEWTRECGIKKFVFASSSSVYGASQKVPFRESDTMQQPLSPYAATKLAGEA